MKNPGASPISSLVQKIASSPAGSRFFARYAHHFDRLIYKLSVKRTTLTSMLTGLPVLVLTTTGAKSGLPRTNPLLVIRDPQNPAVLALIASNWGQPHHPAWYFNLKANPRASGVLEGYSCIYIAHETQGDEYNHYWNLACEIYPGYALYKARAGERHIPIMLLVSDSAGSD
jgi:deazaflavin-dependent oxidoreductase (nitroreductase family)